MKPGSYDHMTDAELLELYRKDGNKEWLGILLKRYTLLLLGVCMKYLKNSHEAHDSVQQIFLKVLTEAGKYRIDYFKSWLYMVAKNHCLMRLREKGGRIAKELTDNYAAEEADRQELIDNEQTYALLDEAIDELSEEQKQSVILFYLKKKSYAQIVEQTGYTMMQVKSYIQNGKRNLRIILERKLKQRSERKP